LELSSLHSSFVASNGTALSMRTFYTGDQIILNFTSHEPWPEGNLECWIVGQGITV